MSREIAIEGPARFEPRGLPRDPVEVLDNLGDVSQALRQTTRVRLVAREDDLTNLNPPPEAGDLVIVAATGKGHLQLTTRGQRLRWVVNGTLEQA